MEGKEACICMQILKRYIFLYMVLIFFFFFFFCFVLFCFVLFCFVLFCFVLLELFMLISAEMYAYDVNCDPIFIWFAKFQSLCCHTILKLHFMFENSSLAHFSFFTSFSPGNFNRKLDARCTTKEKTKVLELMLTKIDQSLKYICQ